LLIDRCLSRPHTASMTVRNFCPFDLYSVYDIAKPGKVHTLSLNRTNLTKSVIITGSLKEFKGDER